MVSEKFLLSMKMMPRHSNQLFNRKNIALIALVAISAFALLYNPIRGALTNSVYTIAPWMWDIGGASSVAFSSFITNFREKEAIVFENKTLHADVLRMQAQVLDRNLLNEKVNNLEEALGRAQDDDRVVAYVLAGPRLSPYDTLVVDAGEDAGVALGNMVVYAGSGAIGEVVEVSIASSKVRLYSSPGEEYSVIVGSRHLPVFAVGRGMGNFEAKVPQDSQVALGDNVVSAKGNLIFGTVSLIEETPAEPVKRIFFRVPFNITEIRSVEVIVDKRL